MTEVWEELFDKVVACVDSFSSDAPPWMRWSFGGGTALMLQLWHRRSKDIDIFLNDPQALTFLSPRLNKEVWLFAQDYVEAQNFLKLKLPKGEIDFIVSPYLTDKPWNEKKIRGRTVLLETPWEIVVKKLFYRSANLQTRDVFDVAAVLWHHPKEIHSSIDLVRSKLDILQKRLDTLRLRYGKEAVANIDVLPAGEAVLRDAPEIVGRFLASVRERSPGKS